MSVPSIDDTIVAVSSAWQRSPVGCVRLSGPRAFVIAHEVGLQPPGDAAVPCRTCGYVRIDGSGLVPATTLWFRAPRSYTGQNVVELYAPGSLPVLRALSAALMAAGARRALPGEFTARAFMLGKLDAAQVDGVLSLLSTHEESSLRAAARQAGSSRTAALAQLDEQLTELLARIEAGIDFVDEDDVRFTTPAEVRSALDDLSAATETLRGATLQSRPHPHVALAGIPNAGKSTLFNALLGRQRAIVSPVLGTTRDVLSAEVTLDGLDVTLQDCAGLGVVSTELELATHVASERAARQADLVLWVHPTDEAWPDEASAVLAALPASRRLLVRSKSDIASVRPLHIPHIEFVEVIEVSAATGAGLPDLRQALVRQIAQQPGSAVMPSGAAELNTLAAALVRARALADGDVESLSNDELIALELRVAHDALHPERAVSVDERILAHIYREFCVGK